MLPPVQDLVAEYDAWTDPDPPYESHILLRFDENACGSAPHESVPAGLTPLLPPFRRARLDSSTAKSYVLHILCNDRNGNVYVTNERSTVLRL